MLGERAVWGDSPQTPEFLVPRTDPLSFESPVRCRGKNKMVRKGKLDEGRGMVEGRAHVSSEGAKKYGCKRSSAKLKKDGN